MSELFIIGLDGYGPTAEQVALLQKSSVIIADKRLKKLIPAGISAPVYPVVPLDAAFANIQEGRKRGNVAVLASGDPLFFGIAGKLIAHFGPKQIRIYPALSSMQHAFALFKMPWDDAAFVSLHGRKLHHPVGKLLTQQKTFFFTDGKNSPDLIARQLISYLENIGAKELMQECRLFVAEDIGTDTQRVTTGSLDEIAAHSFSKLNVVCLLRPELSTRSLFGLVEDEISHSRGLITKDEVRAATLHRLRLPQHGVFWDIGGGSGSISVEAASLNPRLSVYTVEKKKEELANIKANICRFNCFNILPVAGQASEVLAELPDPDRVFIGGSGGELQTIVREAAARLSPQGRLVINGVTAKTVEQAPKIMEENGLRLGISTMTVSRTGADGPVQFNPITIMVGQK